MSLLQILFYSLVLINVPVGRCRYVNLDDCYVKSRLPNGTLVPDARTFPSGMRSLGNYIHNVSTCTDRTVHNMSICNTSASAGMLFGVYTDRGPLTCAGRPAAQGWEAVDAATYANWTVDYLKEDSVSHPPPTASLWFCARGSIPWQPSAFCGYDG